MVKHIFGYIFIVIAVILGIIVFFSLNDIQANIAIIFRYLISNSIDDFALGHSIGGLLVQVILIGITIFLFIIGRKWIKTKK